MPQKICFINLPQVGELLHKTHPNIHKWPKEWEQFIQVAFIEEYKRTGTNYYSTCGFTCISVELCDGRELEVEVYPNPVMIAQYIKNECKVVEFNYDDIEWCKEVELP